MKRRRPPLERLETADAAAKARVALVLEVLSGEKPIARACAETGVKPLAYYKLEERMLRAMVEAAGLPAGRRRGPSTAAEGATLAAETEVLRVEHRRLRSLVRVSRKLVALGVVRRRKGKRRQGKELAPAAPAEVPARMEE